LLVDVVFGGCLFEGTDQPPIHHAKWKQEPVDRP